MKLIRSNELHMFIFDTIAYFGQLIFVLTILLKLRRTVFNAYSKYIIYVGLDFISVIQHIVSVESSSLLLHSYLI